MAQPITSIPIEHHPVTHEVATSFGRDWPSVTLFELVEAVSEVTEDVQEILATVDWMLGSGRVKRVHAPSPKRSEPTPLEALAAFEELDPPERQLA